MNPIQATRLLALGVFSAAALALAPAPTHAQQRDTAQLRREAERRLGTQVSQDEIIERLRRSGMTRSQVRAELQRMGMDPTIADRYFDLLEADLRPPPGYADDDFVRALRRMGVLRSDSGRIQLPDSLREDSIFRDSLRRALPDSLAFLLGLDTIPTDSLREEEDTLAAKELPIFGKALFQRARSTEFEPVLLGPVDGSYRLGPGDELTLILTGDVELAYDPVVTREGTIVIPDVGQVPVAGLSIAQLEDRLYDRLGRVYSGVRRGPDATTRFQLSLARLRANQVFVVGDVEDPGARQVSGAATVFHALHRAGGPAENGSFRRIEVRRGQDVIREVDLYDYLLRGEASADVRLQNGDIVFVPPVGPQVRVEGAAKRPAIYELREDDDLRDVLRFAGGPDAAAALRSVKIDRILPPVDRRPGIERVLMDVDVVSLLVDDGPPIPLHDGDRVQLFEISDERRNVVTVAGQVRRAGSFTWRPGTTLWDVIDRAEGLSETAYTARAHIFRLNELEGTRRLIRTPLIADGGGRPVRDIALADRDSIVVYSMERLRTADTVSIEGYVKRPGNYVLAEGMTVEDLVLAAGGFTEGAYRLEADVARRAVGPQRSDTTARVIRVSLLDSSPSPAQRGSNGESGGAMLARSGNPLPDDDGAPIPTAPDVPFWLPGADEVSLVTGDRVYVRKAPGFEEPRTVKLTGEVMLAGEYVLQTRTERLTDLLERAGGLTSEAYAPGVQLVRKGDLVGTDVERALRDPGTPANITLEHGDSLHVPRFDPTVLVTGAVAFRTRVPYRDGAGLDWYIERAGGFDQRADKDRVSVTYLDGERSVVKRRTLLPDSNPRPGPGSTIHVPERDPSDTGFDWDAFLSRTLGVLGTTATVLIAISSVK